MALNTKHLPSKSFGPKQEPLKAGNYPARVVQVIDLGLQEQRPFKGEIKPPAYEVMMTYEFSTEFMKDENGNELEDKPRWISERFPIHSLKADKAKSTKRYLALDPDEVFDGDFSLLLGSPCTVTVVNNVKPQNPEIVYNNVGNVTPPMAIRGFVQPELVNDPVAFDLSDPDVEVFKAFPSWIQDLIKSNLEFRGSLLDRRLSGQEDTPSPAPAPVTRQAAQPKAEEPGEDIPW